MSQKSNKPNDFAKFGCNVINVMFPGKVIINRPFYRYGGHIELIRFKEYYRMSRGHEHISFAFLSTFRDIFS